MCIWLGDEKEHGKVWFTVVRVVDKQYVVQQGTQTMTNSFLFMLTPQWKWHKNKDVVKDAHAESLLLKNWRNAISCWLELPPPLTNDTKILIQNVWKTKKRKMWWNIIFQIPPILLSSSLYAFLAKLMRKDIQDKNAY